MQTAADQGDEAVRPRWALPVVATTTALAAVMTVVLLVPVPDGVRRPVVLGLFCALLVVQVTAGVVFWRGGWGSVTPRWVGIVSAGGVVSGLMAGFFYAVPHTGEQTALSSAVSGAGIGVFVAAALWLTGRNDHAPRHDSSRTHGAADDRRNS